MKIALDFPLLLTALVILSGMIFLIDACFFARKRKAANAKPGIIIDYARSFFPILLIVLILRSFIIQPYRVPTGSLEPTVLPGDFIVVNQFAYGLRLPVLNTKIVNIGEPKRGDIALFRWPIDPTVVFVKRVVGVPGDHIKYENKVLTINGVVAKQKDLGPGKEEAPKAENLIVNLKAEELPPNIMHKILVQPNSNNIGGDFELTVPDKQYFMMGDNRDNSDDSRYWGFVPEQNLVGKAFGIWMSWDNKTHMVRWEQIGKKIQ